MLLKGIIAKVILIKIVVVNAQHNHRLIGLYPFKLRSFLLVNIAKDPSMAHLLSSKINSLNLPENLHFVRIDFRVSLLSLVIRPRHPISIVYSIAL